MKKIPICAISFLIASFIWFGAIKQNLPDKIYDIIFISIIILIIEYVIYILKKRKQK